jgi:hypothetical protein
VDERTQRRHQGRGDRRQPHAPRELGRGHGA